MSENRKTMVVKSVKAAKWIGMVLIVMGVLSIVLPQQSGIAVSVGVGILLILAGIFQLAFLFLSLIWGSLFLRLIFGLATIIAGGIMIADPAGGIGAITIIITIYFLVDGITEILMGLRYPPVGGGFWIVGSGVLSLVLGIMIWRSWPVSGEVLVPILIGIKLLVTGLMFLAVTSASTAILAGAASDTNDEN